MGDAENSTVVTGDGYAVGSIDDMADGPGFRKIRRELGVTAFGINAIALPPGFATGRHYHDEQEETYFVHRGRIAMEFGDGSSHELGPGGVARVDAATVRRIRNVGARPDGARAGRLGRAPSAAYLRPGSPAGPKRLVSPSGSFPSRPT